MSQKEEIKRLVQEGKSNLEISRTLSISRNCVEAVILSILHEMNVNDPSNYALYCKLNNR